MPNNKIILGSIATFLLVIVIFMVVQMNQRPQSARESLQETIQELENEVIAP